MAPTPIKPAKAAEAAPAAPKIIRLIRDGFVWQVDMPWPTPQGIHQLPFRVSDIFWDDEEREYKVFGVPLQAKDYENFKLQAPPSKSAEAMKNLCLLGRVPHDLGSAISDSFLTVAEALAEVANYLEEGAEAWADRWGDDEDEPGAPALVPDGGES